MTVFLKGNILQTHMDASSVMFPAFTERFWSPNLKHPQPGDPDQVQASVPVAATALFTHRHLVVFSAASHSCTCRLLALFLAAPSGLYRESKASKDNFFYNFSVFTGCLIATSLLTHQFFLPHVEWIHTLKMTRTRTHKRNRELKV